jgi:hypothetical protein
MTATPPKAPGRQVRFINNDNGACRCPKIRNHRGGMATHTRGECRDLPDPKAR